MGRLKAVPKSNCVGRWGVGMYSGDDTGAVHMGAPRWHVSEIAGIRDPRKQSPLQDGKNEAALTNTCLIIKWQCGVCLLGAGQCVCVAHCLLSDHNKPSICFPYFHLLHASTSQSGHTMPGPAGGAAPPPGKSFGGLDPSVAHWWCQAPMWCAPQKKCKPQVSQKTLWGTKEVSF